MSDFTYDVIIVGGGPIGLSAAYQCLKKQQSVLLIEKFSFHNDYGSSPMEYYLFQKSLDLILVIKKILGTEILGDKKILGYKIKIVAIKLTKTLAIKKILGTEILGDKKILGYKIKR